MRSLDSHFAAWFASLVLMAGVGGSITRGEELPALPAAPAPAIPTAGPMNVEAALDAMMPEVNFASTALPDVFAFLADRTQANIVVNWKALEASGVTRDVAVDLKLKNVRFSKVIELVLSQVGGEEGKLGYDTQGGVLTISSGEDIVRGRELREVRRQQKDFSQLQARLERRIETVDLKDSNLIDALNYVADQSNTNVVVRWKLLEAVSVNGDSKVTVKLRDARLADVLKAILEQAAVTGELIYQLRDGAIHVQTP